MDSSRVPNSDQTTSNVGSRRLANRANSCVCKISRQLRQGPSLHANMGIHSCVTIKPNSPSESGGIPQLGSLGIDCSHAVIISVVLVESWQNRSSRPLWHDLLNLPFNLCHVQSFSRSPSLHVRLCSTNVRDNRSQEDSGVPLFTLFSVLSFFSLVSSPQESRRTALTRHVIK